MWILPSQLLNSAPGMAALDLDSKTSLASECEPSHIVSLRGSLKPISSVKWKKDSWMSHLYGTILKPSHTNRFTDWWISSLRDTLANHFPAQESEQEKKTQDISGLGLQTEFDFFNQECASLKMSKDISRWDSPQSSVIWKNWVTKCRGEYSVRVKLAQSTKGKECSSWPTIRVNQAEDCASERRRKNPSLDSIVKQNWPTPTAGECLDQGTNWETLARLDKGGRILRRMASLEMSGPHDPDNHNTHGSRPELLSDAWPTPTALSRVRNEETMEKCLNFRQSNGQTTVPLYLEERVNIEEMNRPETWATPNSFCFQPPENTEQWTKRAEFQQTEKGVNLHKPIQSQVLHENEKVVGAMPPSAAKLNQRWVETLMGLPMGWTSPSCPASVIQNWPKFVNGWLKATTAQTNYDPAEMELFQQQQNERSES